MKRQIPASPIQLALLAGISSRSSLAFAADSVALGLRSPREEDRQLTEYSCALSDPFNSWLHLEVALS
jgi:hypothetical protein